MEISFEELRDKEVVNIFNGKRLGRVVDIIIDLIEKKLKAIVVPGDKKLFKKSEDILIPIKQIYRIGDDVILVGLNVKDDYKTRNEYAKSGDFNQLFNELPTNIKYKKENSFIRYRRINNIKYK